MVQQFIDYGIEFIFWAFAAHTVLYFTAGFMARRNRIAPGQLSLLDEQLQPIWDGCATDDGKWLDEVKPIAIPDGVFCCDADPIDAALVDGYIQNRKLRAIDNVVPFVRPTKRQQQAIDWNTLTPYQLRSECQKRGIRWRNARPDGKHLRKEEMVQALSQSVAA
ncbi:MAG TPA: hypothetical protein V6C65_36615 [Allocoleopsis sp.]